MLNTQEAWRHITDLIAAIIRFAFEASSTNVGGQGALL